MEDCKVNVEVTMRARVLDVTPKMMAHDFYLKYKYDKNVELFNFFAEITS